MTYIKPRRTFEKFGVVSPEKSYHVRLENVTNTDKQDIKTMVDLGRYFCIFAPRQSGKTTFFKDFCRDLEKDPMYTPIRLSFQFNKDLSTARFYELIQEDLYNQLIKRLESVRCVNLKSVRLFLEEHQLTDHTLFYSLFVKLNQILPPKRIIIFIDEFDGIPVSELENFLTVLRELYQKYKERKDKALYSVGLVGIRDVTMLTVGGVSPFNIADQVTLSPFSLKNVRDLYAQYTNETNQPFEEEAVKRVLSQTAGQLWLVNRLGSILTVDVKPGTTDPITAEDVDEAIERLVLEINSHFDNLQEKIKTRVAAFEKIAFQDVDFNPVNEDHCFLLQYGVIKVRDKKAVIANPVYEKRLLKLFSENGEGMSDDAARSRESMAGSSAKTRIFISYSHRDEKWKDHLMTHLDVFQQQNQLEVWDDRRITPGEDWFNEIQKALADAKVAVLLISANFLGSSFIREKEIPTLLEKRRRDGLKVIPVIVKPCAWEAAPWLASMQAVPEDGTPLMKGTEYEIEEKFAEIARRIASII